MTDNMQGRYTTQYIHHCSYASRILDAPANTHLKYTQAWIKMPQDPPLWLFDRSCKPEDQQKYIHINGVYKSNFSSALKCSLF